LGNRLELEELFPDRALAACVRSAIESADGNRVSERELTSVFRLTCNGDLAQGGRISALDGLDHLPNLVDLDLSGNDVGDLSGLAQAPQLTTLTLTNNAVRDLSPLAGLASLQELGLSGNEVTDIAPLAGLTALPRGALVRNVVLGDEAEVSGHPGPGGPVPDPGHGLRIVGIRPVEHPVQVVGVEFGDLLGGAGRNAAEQLVDHLPGVHVISFAGRRGWVDDLPGNAGPGRGPR
jgi:hypothetical protein